MTAVVRGGNRHVYCLATGIYVLGVESGDTHYVLYGRKRYRLVDVSFVFQSPYDRRVRARVAVSIHLEQILTDRMIVSEGSCNLSWRCPSKIESLGIGCR